VFGLSAGYHWTTHVKLEADAAATTWGRSFVQQQLAGSIWRIGQQRVRSDRLAAGLHYQFLENAWFHPFAGGGIEAERETGRLETAEQRPCQPGLCTSPTAREAFVNYRLRPFVQTGFKWYVAERAFVRSDARVVFAPVGVSRMRWQIGAGVDF
jgi:hypothetical protein